MEKLKRIMLDTRTRAVALTLLILSLVTLLSPLGGEVYADEVSIPDITADVNTEGVPYVELLGNNVDYSDYLHIVYAYSCNFEEGMNQEDVRVLFWNEPQSSYTLESKTQVYTSKPYLTGEKIKILDKTYENCLMVSSYGIPAVEIGDTVYARAYVTAEDGSVYYSEVAKYSVLQYVYSRFEDKELGYNVTDVQLNLYNKLLGYGGAAQNVLNYKEDRLANGKYVKITAVGGCLTDGFTSGLYANGDKAMLYAEPEKDGAIFLGWYDGVDNCVSKSSLMTVTVTEKSKSETYTAKYLNEATVSVKGGTFSDGKTSMDVPYGSYYTVVADIPDGKSFAYWLLNGERVAGESTHTVKLDSFDVLDIRWEAVLYDGVGAHIEDLTVGSSVGTSSSTGVYSGGYKVYGSKGSGAGADGFKISVVSDPENSANAVIKAVKSVSGNNTGSSVIVAAKTFGGATTTDYEWAYFNADIRLDSVKDAVPMQISLGSAYRLEFRYGDSVLQICDSNTQGKYNFLGAIAELGEWFNLKVIFKSGEVVADSNTGEILSNTIKAYVYVNDKLVAISQNPREMTKNSSTGIYLPNHSNSVSSVKFYLLNAEISTFYVDNVEIYTTNEDLTPENIPDNVLLFGLPSDETEWANRFAMIYALYGDDAPAIVDALFDMDTIFTEEIYEWIAGLYDPDTGAFYYSNSARDSFGYLPDIESSSQIKTILTRLGLASSTNALFTPEQKAKLVSWVQLLQSNRDGYYYHPQWGTAIGASRQGRDLGNCDSMISSYGGTNKYLFNTAAYRLSNGKSGYSGNAVTYTYSSAALASSENLSSPLSTSSVVAVSKLLMTAALNPTEQNKFSSPEMFAAYLDWRWEASGHNTYSFGNYITAQSSQIKAKGEEYIEVCINWFDSYRDEIQAKLVADGKEMNGLWDEEVNYRSISALLKISGIYNNLGAVFNYPIEALRSAMEMLVRPVDAPIPSDAKEPNAFKISGNGIVYVYNPPSAMNNIINNLKKHNTTDNAAALLIEAISLVRQNAPEIIGITKDKLELFRKSDGSFGYYPDKSSSSSQGMPAAVPGSNEGDVNGTALALGTRSAILTIYGLTVNVLPTYKGAITLDGKPSSHLERFQSLLTARESIVKQFANGGLGYVYDFEDIEGLMPTESANVESTTVVEGGNTVLKFTDTNASGGAKLTFPLGTESTLDEGYIETSIDIKCIDNLNITTNHQLTVSSLVSFNLNYNKTTKTIKFVNRYYNGTSTNPGSEKSQETTGTVNAYEWFTVKIIVYPDRDASQNGFAHIRVEQGGKVVVDQDIRGRYTNSSDLAGSASLAFFSLKDSVATAYVDNVVAKRVVEVNYNGEYHFDYTNELSAGVSGGNIVKDGDNHLEISGTNAKTTLSAAGYAGAYDFNELKLDLMLAKKSVGTSGEIVLKDSDGLAIVKLALKVESDGTMSITEAKSGVTLITGICLDEWMTIKVEYHHDIGELDVSVKYTGADGLATAKGASVKSLPAYDSSADASEYSSVSISFASSSTTTAYIDNAFVRNVKK